MSQSLSSSLVRRGIFLCLIIIVLTAILPHSIQAEEGKSVYDAIQGGGIGNGSTPDKDVPVNGDSSFSLFPFLVKFFLSFAFIILLIYLFLKFLSSKARGFQSRGPFTLLGGCTLGSNRTLQAVLVGETIYLLGVGENVQLIRSIPKSEEYDLILNQLEVESTPEPSLPWKRWFGKKEKEEQNWNEILAAKLLEFGDEENRKP